MRKKQKANVSCGCCGEDFNEEEKESPRKDNGGDPICDSCYSEHYEDECDRCGEWVEKIELEMRPKELVAFWEEVDGLKPGYYRVLKWPIYMDGMITGYVIKDSLQFVAPLDKRGEAAAKGANAPGGRLCCACRKEIEGLLKHGVTV